VATVKSVGVLIHHDVDVDVDVDDVCCVSVCVAMLFHLPNL
jgi:hypothetical protein